MGLGRRLLSDAEEGVFVLVGDELEEDQREDDVLVLMSAS